MMGHLSDEELTDFLLDRDQRHLRRTLDALAREAQSMGDRPERYWERQRTAVWARISARKKGATHRLGALAGAVSLILFALALFVVHRPRPKVPLRAQADRDQELLMRVEQTIESDGPQALEPAALLAEEISREARSGSGGRHSSEGEKHP